MVLKIFFVVAQYTVTFVMDMANDRLKQLDPNDKVGNEGLIRATIFLFFGIAFFSGV